MTRKSLGDKFREAAGMIEDGWCDFATYALLKCVSAHKTRDAFWALFPQGLEGREHRIIALLLAAAMADTGDLK